MASKMNAEWVKERVTCPTCLLSFENPQTFPCLHTYCKKCVNKLQMKRKQGVDGYVCPLCREFTTPDTNQVEFSDVWPFPLARLCKEKPVKVSAVKLEGGCYVRHISMVTGELWVPVENNYKECINVYSPSGEFLRTLELPPVITNVRAVIPTVKQRDSPSTQDIAAIASSACIYTITRDGQVVQTLANGQFYDLCIYDGKMYALNNKQSLVVFCRDTDAKWIKEQDIRVAYTDGLFIRGTLNIHNGRVFVCSYNYDKVCEFTMSGDKSAEHGSKKYNGVNAGELYGALLSGSDVTGCMLVCDSINKRVQLLSADGTWSITTLQQLDVQPQYCVPVDDRSFWMINWAGDTLQLYRFDN